MGGGTLERIVTRVEWARAPRMGLVLPPGPRGCDSLTAQATASAALCSLESAAGDP